jgi:predicted nucleotidyltransferase
MMDSKIETAVDVIRGAVHGLVAVYLYGSMAAGNTNDGSDCDLAVLAEAPVDRSLLWDLRGRLSEHLACEVDFVDLRAAPSVLAMQIVAHGIVVHGDESRERGAFEDFVFASYARLNEERSAILADVADRGSVYG